MALDVHNLLVKLAVSSREFRVPIGKDKFRMLETDNEVTFIRNDQGEVIERLIEFDGGALRNKKLKDVASNGQ